MARTKKIQKSLNKQWFEMRKNIDSLCVTWDKEKLHDLRLNAKKIKAIVSLLKACLPANKLSIKKLKELFDHAGEIRTAQLNIEALHASDIQNEQLEKQQNEIIERESYELCRRRKTYNTNIKKLRKNIEISSNKIKTKNIISFYEERLEELSVNFLPPVNEATLHDNRKIIKTLLLALKALPKSLQKQININKKYLDELQDMIGKWHDTIIVSDLLATNGLHEQETVKDKKEKQLETIKNLTNSFDVKAQLSG